MSTPKDQNAANNDTPPRPPLPLRANRRKHDEIIIAHHLILHGYGHWLANDRRGSGSDELRQAKFADLGPIHPGRKPVQPPRDRLRRFYQEAATRLDYPPLWFDDAKRQAIGESFAQVVSTQRYTVWACAVLTNHAHLCIRRHRDDAVTMWHNFAEQSRKKLCLFADVCDDHPLWSNRPYKVFLFTPDDVRRIVKYIEENPPKHGLPPQHWPFVKPYDGWPSKPRNRP